MNAHACGEIKQRKAIFYYRRCCGILGADRYTKQRNRTGKDEELHQTIRSCIGTARSKLPPSAACALKNKQLFPV